jgi:hypothetical protein
MSLDLIEILLDRLAIFLMAATNFQLVLLVRVEATKVIGFSLP